MANIHPQENELFEKIKSQQVTLSKETWSYIYSVFSDNLTAIKMIITCFNEKGELPGKDELKRMLGLVRMMYANFRKIYQPEKLSANISGLDKVREDSKKISGDLKELFGHYLGNDINVISFVVSHYLDPLEESQMTQEDVDKILIHVNSMQSFLEKLRYATINIETIIDRVRNKIQFPYSYLLEVEKNKDFYDETKISRCVENLKDVKSLLDKCS